jgi:hypothetical protein
VEIVSGVLAKSRLFIRSLASLFMFNSRLRHRVIFYMLRALSLRPTTNKLLHPRALGARVRFMCVAVEPVLANLVEHGSIRALVA